MTLILNVLVDDNNISFFYHIGIKNIIVVYIVFPITFMIFLLIIKLYLIKAVIYLAPAYLRPNFIHKNTDTVNPRRNPAIH